jgi:hypothetical protein
LNTSNESLRKSGMGRTASSSAVKYSPLEKDFLFNARESEEDFMRKTRTAGSKRQP